MGINVKHTSLPTRLDLGKSSQSDFQSESSWGCVSHCLQRVLKLQKHKGVCYVFVG